MPVKIYTSADGLGSSYVNFLMRDSRGFLWICTRDGLSRFDGRQFITYQIGATDSPPGIEFIYETKNGIYWITTTGGLFRFDPHIQNQPRLKENDRTILNAAFVSHQRGFFYEDRGGNLWYYGDGLYRVDEQHNKFEMVKYELNLPNNPLIEFGIKSMFEDDEGSFWFLTTWGLVRRTVNGNIIFYSVESAQTDAMISMVKDKNNRIWVSRQTGIYVLKPESISEIDENNKFIVRKFEARAEIQSEKSTKLPEKSGEIFKFTTLAGLNNNLPKILYRTGDEHIWISTDESLIEFDGKSFQVYTSGQGITGGAGKMTEDLEGNLWVGGAKGLSRLNRSGFTTFSTDDGLRTPNILFFNESKDGKLYVGSNDFYLSELDGKKFQTVKLPVPINAKALWTSNSIFLDSRNRWWFLTSEKLYLYEARKGLESLPKQHPIAEINSRNGLKSDQIFHVFEDKKGDFWISTRGAVSENFYLTRWDQADNSYFTFSEAENFPEKKSVSAFAEDSEGNLWIGFYEGGLVRYSAGRFTKITSGSRFFESELVSALHIDQKGRLWISSSKNGLGRVDDLTGEPLKMIIYNKQNGLSSNNVRSITEDNFGQIYAGTARGVDRINPETGRIKNYSTNDGLAGDFVQTSFRDRQGILWFGTPNGVSKLVPVRESSSNPPPVWVSGLRVAGENYSIPELGSAEISTLELSPAQNNLQIDFFGIDFNPSESLTYQYLLEGADTDWSPPTEQRTVNYSNLSPGNYRFMVQAVNANGVASEKPATFSFRLPPPIWKRWWFILIFSVLIGTGFLAIYRYRLAKLKAINTALRELQISREERLAELERVRSRIARDLHDDVGSSLTQIALYSEVAKHREKEQISVSEPLQFLVNTSNELVEAMSDIVWAINPHKDHLRDLTQRMRHFASEVLSAAEIDLEFNSPSMQEDVPLGANLRREVFLIFKESINNIVKHSGAGTAEIDFLLEKDILTLRIKDNGKGFDPQKNGEFDWKKVRGGNGLLNMKRRAKDLGGECLIISEIGNGTFVSLQIPLGPDLKN